MGRAACLGVIAIVLAGCAVLKRDAYDVPAIPLPADYKNSPAAASEGKDRAAGEPRPLRAGDPAQDVALPDWWRAFGSRELDELVDRGFANNPDMRMATLRVAQVKARADQAKAGLVPNISAPVAVGRGAVPVGTGLTQSQTSFQASLRGSWRLDVWGEQSAIAESADLQLWRAVFERDNVQRNLASSLASAYVEYLSLNDRLRVARETEATLNSTLKAIENRVAAGDATVSELEQQRAAIFAARAAIPSLEQQREDAINAIAFLVGSVPGSLKLSDRGLDSLGVPEAVPGLPSALILRRPDVRMMEARLLAADADIDVARARVLPPIDLAAQAGYSSVNLAQLFLPRAFFWNTVSSLTANIFDRGRQDKDKEFAQAAYEEMVEGYVRTVHQAIREVESALASVRLAERRLGAQRDATQAARRAWDINTQVYSLGAVDYLTLLDTERTYHRYEDELQRVQMDHLRGYISLFTALGGGVKTKAPIPGNGSRPADAPGGKLSVALSREPSGKAHSSEGVTWDSGTFSIGGMQIEKFWQVELAGLYHRSTIGSAWRDLRARYPQYMESRVLRPRLSGRVEDGGDGQEAWYRLYVAKFATRGAAQEFCAALQSGQQRCRVLSSRMEEGGEEGEAMAKQEGSDAPGDGTLLKASTGLAAAPGVQPAAEKAAMAGEPREPAPPRDPVRSPAEREPSGRLAYAVQLGQFSNPDNADISLALWQFKGYDAYVSEQKDKDGRTWYAVRSGSFPQRREAVLLAQAIRNKEDAAAVVVPTVVESPVRERTGSASGLSPLQAGKLPPAVPEPPEAQLPGALPTARLAGRDGTRGKPVYSLQLGAFSSRENAVVSYDFWQGKGYGAYVAEIRDGEGRTWYAVRLGAYAQRREASARALALGRREDAQVVVVPAATDRDGRPLAIDLGHGTPAAAQTKATPEAIESASPVAAEPPREPAATAAPATAGKPSYSVQLAVFSSVENAARFLAANRSPGYEPYVCEIQDGAGRTRYAVRAGHFQERRDASAALKAISRRAGARPLLVPALLGQDGLLATVNVSHLVEGQN